LLTGFSANLKVAMMVLPLGNIIVLGVVLARLQVRNFADPKMVFMRRHTCSSANLKVATMVLHLSSIIVLGVVLARLQVCSPADLKVGMVVR
jgi:xanthosine utilization system XapX-like protein